jgi:hypothetical protein
MEERRTLYDSEIGVGNHRYETVRIVGTIANDFHIADIRTTRREYHNLTVEEARRMAQEEGISIGTTETENPLTD